MSDLISRKEAVEELHTCQTYLFDSRDHDLKISLEDAEYAIQQLPTAEPGWIPVSDSPKKDGRYLVTRLDYVTDTKFADILWYEENTWWNRRAIGDYAVIAWMPLPEPYQEEDK